MDMNMNVKYILVSVALMMATGCVEHKSAPDPVTNPAPNKSAKLGTNQVPSKTAKLSTSAVPDKTAKPVTAPASDKTAKIPVPSANNEPASVATLPAQTVRADEMAAAQQLRKDIAAILATLPPAQAHMARVNNKVKMVASPDNKRGKKANKVLAFDSLSVVLPIAANGTPQYTATMDKVKEFARQVADNRGASEIILGYNARDVKAQNIELGSDVTKSKANNPITVTKRVDPTLKAELRSITVKAAK